MSEKRAKLSADRRARRTRKALLEAFLALIAERGYRRIRVADIVARADVARSTFYDHFKDKDDLLRASMSGIYATLADIADRNAKLENLVGLFAHFWENRRLARELFAGPSAPLGPRHGTRHLAAVIAERLAAQARAAKARPAIPLMLAAMQLAEGAMAVLREWVTGKASCGPAALARSVHAAASSAAAAFIAAR